MAGVLSTARLAEERFGSSGSVVVALSRSPGPIGLAMIHCADCLDEFHDGPRFAVIKEDTTRDYTIEERLMGGGLYQAIVCENCAGWYDDSAEIERSDDEPARAYSARDLPFFLGISS